MHTNLSITQVGWGDHPDTTRLKITATAANGVTNIAYFDVWNDCIETATAVIRYRIEQGESPSDCTLSLGYFADELGEPVDDRCPSLCGCGDPAKHEEVKL